MANSPQDYESDDCENGKKTGIWFDMDKETNRLLSISAKVNKRTKKQEASFRLSHHLRKFDKHFNPCT